jgi:N-acetylglutamate synthase-like GNAT family acetyltransferase
MRAVIQSVAVVDAGLIIMNMLAAANSPLALLLSCAIRPAMHDSSHCQRLMSHGTERRDDKGRAMLKVFIIKSLHLYL